jgi:hypothetical protein
MIALGIIVVVSLCGLFVWSAIAGFWDVLMFYFALSGVGVMLFSQFALTVIILCGKE